ncbi:MAG: ankyrin repeat domain-containing protein [Alphaproteobacteria bacterium]|nr:ankyrin repeat domain-containing protein [Alphaproteobacteria bacterium]
MDRSIKYRTHFVAQNLSNPNEEAMCVAAVEQGVDLLWCAEKDGATLLHLAAREGQEKLVRALIGAGADMEARTKDTLRTPLGEAFPVYGAGKVDRPAPRLSVMKMLLEAGADPDVKDSYESTELMYAAAGGCAPVVKLLLDKGADERALNQRNKTAAQLAAEKGKMDIAAYIEAYAQVKNDGLLVQGTPADSWRLLDENRIVRQTLDIAMGTCVSDIFNFKAEDRQVQVRRLDAASGAFSATAPVAFHAVAPPCLEEAHQAYEKLGGKEPLHVTLPGRVTRLLPKPRISSS